MDTKVAIKLKKDGQKYTKSELKKMGWTESMIKHLPPQKARKGQGIYYRASDVRAALEEHEEIRAHIAETLAAREEEKKLREAANAERVKIAQELAVILDNALANARLSPDVRCIAEIWHKIFLEALLDPLPIKSEKSRVSSQRKAVLSRLHDFSAKKRNGSTWPHREMSRWQDIGRSMWLTRAPGVPAVGANVYIQALTDFAEREIQGQLVDKGITESVTDIFASEAVRAHYPNDRFLYEAYIAYYVPEVISRDLSKLIAVDPKDEYPAARQMTRRFEIHVGGTNTGKTYQSLQRLKAAPTGVYLAPLRLLALEVQERLLDEGVICSMLTGEEEDIRENATHISSTVEKLDIHRHYDVAVIDECQLINDQERGFAWTRAILGVQAEEIHLCVAPEGLHILERLIKNLGESYTIVKHERKVPLNWIDRPVPMKQAQQGDAFVAFSKRRVLQLADELRQKGIPTSIIYGNLPYSTRRRQMQMFLDGETTALVATDAIGMGLNLPIRRVIFTEGSKYDGRSTRPLKASEVRQIAGRAGRFGLYDEGFAAAGPYCDVDLGSRLEKIPPDVDTASLGFSELVLKVDRPLIDVLRVWNQMPAKEPFVRMDIRHHIAIISHIQNVLHLEFSKKDLLRAANIPFDERDESLLSLFSAYCKSYIAGEECVQKPEPSGKMLGDLELYYKELDLYYSFSKNFALAWDKEWLMQEKESVAEEINELLVHDLRNRASSCRKCGAPIALDSRYTICDKCHQRQIQQQRRIWNWRDDDWY